MVDYSYLEELEEEVFEEKSKPKRKPKKKKKSWKEIKADESKRNKKTGKLWTNHPDRI